MARDTSPILKRCRALGIEPSAMGYFKKSKRNPQKNRRKLSEYGLQLREKQKVKFIYGVLERQFRKTYETAARMSGKTGENLLILLERRMDNVIYRLGLGVTRAQARQLVTHGHFAVNGHRLDIASALVNAGDVITVIEGSKKIAPFAELGSSVAVPKWLSLDLQELKATVVQLPTREDCEPDIEETLIVELYSK